MPTAALHAVTFFGLATAAEFVLAMWLYFRRSDREHLANRLWSCVALAAVAIHGRYLLQADSSTFTMLSISATCFALANGLFWAAVWTHAGQRPNVVFGEAVPQRLITHGPYRAVRHPFYLAYILGFAGSTCIGLHWLQFATTFALFVLYNHAAAREERLLTSAEAFLSDDYAEYKRRTWRWLPLVW